MVTVNHNYLKLPGSYLFSTIGKKVRAYKEENPDKEVISLGIGDVTQPLVPAIIDALHGAVEEMAHAETFHGYAPDLGYEFLRRQSQRTITRTEDAMLQQMRFLFLMVQKVIPVIFRRFLEQIIRLLCVTRFIRFMWIPMLWRAVPESIIRFVKILTV